MGIFAELLSLLSGGTGDVEVSEQLLFDKVIGFKGITEGCGASTLVQNVAAALNDNTRYKICVVDTNMLYPCQHELLGSSDDTPDIQDFGRGIPLGDIINTTRFDNVVTVGFKNRTIVDLVAVTETTSTYDKLLSELKKYYDIILVDLSHETSNFATEAAIKCNKIFMVCDTSMKATSNLVKSYNYMTTLGVSLTKCKRIILNKTINVNAGLNSIISELNLEVFGQMPFSELVYKQGVVGRAFYGMATRDSAITEAHILLDKLVTDIVEESRKNEHKLKKKKVKDREIDFSQDETQGSSETAETTVTDVVGLAKKVEISESDDEPVFSEGDGS